LQLSLLAARVRAHKRYIHHFVSLACCSCQCHAAGTIACLMWRLVVQRIMQITESQKAAMFVLRRKFISKMAHASRHRQQLVQQLQSAPPAVCMSHHELDAGHNLTDSITCQLQECVRQEDALLHDHVMAMVFQVRLLLRSCASAVCCEMSTFEDNAMRLKLLLLP